MTYRGEDLDLRTPQGRGARESYSGGEGGLNGARGRGAASGGNRADALYVDDTVLACCNHAYDIALAHGATEVRLEHLVHAMTRVEAAAEILEQRGIREAHLRRESAAVIASEIPVGLAHSHAAPRSSIEFEDVLRLASDQSRGRSTAATVHDLLWVMLNYNREIPAIALLLRHAADWQQWDWPQQQNRREQPARVPAYYNDSRRTSPYEPQPSPRMRETGIPPPPTQVNYAQSSADLDPVHNRLDQMEMSLRKMQNDMATDRRAFIDLMREIQRDVAASRGNGAAVPAAVFDRLQQGVEHAFDIRTQDLGRSVAGLAERLGTIEKSMTSGMQDGARNWAALSERFKNLDKVLAVNPNAGLGDLVTEQLVAVTEQVREATEKLQSLERNLDVRQTEGQRAWATVAERLRAVDEALVAQRQQTVELKNVVATDMRGALERTAQVGGSLQSLVTDRFQALNQQFDQQGLSITSAVAQVTEPLTRQLEARLGEQMQVFRTLDERSTQIETLVRTTNQEATATHQRDLAEVHDALLKLGSNQQTLAENLESWRAEHEGSLSIVSNRLELLESSSAQPLAILKQLQTDMQGVQQVTLADYDKNRRGIRQWLFGTDDIFAGTWRDETAQIRARLRQMRDDRKA
jgi:hypothetical protein